MSWKLTMAAALGLSLVAVFARLAQDAENGTATWDASRAAGFAAYLLLWASTVTGLALYLRVRPGRAPMTWMLETHRITSALCLSFVVGHVVSILLDPVVTFSWYDGLVPFTSDWRPLQVGAGTIAQWLLVVVLASTALAGRMPYAMWRKLHYLSFPCWGLALLHGITSGTDTSSQLGLLIYAITGASVAGLLAVRVFGRGFVAAGERVQRLG